PSGRRRRAGGEAEEGRFQTAFGRLQSRYGPFPPPLGHPLRRVIGSALVLGARRAAEPHGAWLVHDDLLHALTFHRFPHRSSLLSQFVREREPESELS